MIQYKKRRKYKYNLQSDYSYQTNIVLEEAIDFGLLSLSKGGMLGIKKGYAWDGASGPTFDTKNFMQGSLVHDALYQLMREGLLSTEFREKADLLLKQVCREDGMSKFRSWYVYHAVRIAGASSAKIDLHSAPFVSAD